MRPVAVTILVLAVLATMPVAPAVNECRDPCKAVTTVATPVNAKTETYYLYVQGASCTPDNSYCRGQPAPIVSGIVYQETNCEGGLQRYKPLLCAADEVVLL